MERTAAERNGNEPRPDGVPAAPRRPARVVGLVVRALRRPVHKVVVGRIHADLVHVRLAHDHGARLLPLGHAPARLGALPHRARGPVRLRVARQLDLVLDRQRHAVEQPPRLAGGPARRRRRRRRAHEVRARAEEGGAVRRPPRRGVARHQREQRLGHGRGRQRAGLVRLVVRADRARGPALRPRVEQRPARRRRVGRVEGLARVALAGEGHDGRVEAVLDVQELVHLAEAAEAGVLVEELGDEAEARDQGRARGQEGAADDGVGRALGRRVELGGRLLRVRPVVVLGCRRCGGHLDGAGSGIERESFKKGSGNERLWLLTWKGVSRSLD
jgi:hypothetical protein